MWETGTYNFDRKIKGFADKEALLCGIEARTSSPIRIIRNILEFPTLKKLDTFTNPTKN